jgi:hypothetical protein
MKHVSIEYKIEELFDEFWDKHKYADFHGIDINNLLDSLLEVGKQADKTIKKLSEHI